MSLFAHDGATMLLECHSRQALGEDIRRLIFTCDLIEFHLRLITRSGLSYPTNTNVDVLGTRIHATPFDEEDTRIVILRYRVIPVHRNHRNDPASVFLSKYF